MTRIKAPGFDDNMAREGVYSYSHNNVGKGDLPGYYGIISSTRGERPQEYSVISPGPHCQSEIIHPRKENQHYSAEFQIGEGSHSTVWFCQYSEKSGPHVFMGDVCLKRPKTAFEDNIVAEYNLLCKIRHPSIIKPWDLFQEEGNLNMVLPYYPQSAYALRGQCDMLTVWRFCESVSGALEYLHDMGLVHHDVKLSNILVGPNGRFILSDLSSAESGSHFEVDDIGFGRAIMELVMGKICFLHGGEPKEMIEKELDAVRIYDDRLRKLIIKCLSRTPNGFEMPNSGYHMPDADYIQWTSVNDFAIIQRNDKYGLINRFGSIVIPVEYDNLSQVDSFSLPGPGPGVPPAMRCLFKKGNRCGSFLIDKDFATLELDITQEDWQNKAMWT